MARLLLESDSDVLNLDGQADAGEGLQAHAGATGFGIPTSDVQWFEGAGSGAVYRGRRVSPRNIELPITILAPAGRADLKGYLDRLTVAVSEPCRLVREEDDGTRWVLEVVLNDDLDYMTGIDTNGETEWSGTLNLRAGLPEWVRDTYDVVNIAPSPTPGEQTYGVVTLLNSGTADAYPVWRVQGPGRALKIVNEEGDGWEYALPIPADETITIDTGTGLVTDSAGNNAYSNMANAPQFPPLKPGRSTWTITMEDRDATGTASVLSKASTTPIRINECVNPMLGALASSGTVEVRRNYAGNPTASVSDSNDFPVGWKGANNAGSGRMVSLSAVTSPLPGITHYSRCRWPTISRGEVAHSRGPSLGTMGPGEWTISAYVYVSSSVSDLRIALDEEWGEGGPWHHGPETSVPANRWRRLSATFTIKNTITTDPFPYVWSQQIGPFDSVYVTGWLVERTHSVRPYFDGNTDNHYGLSNSYVGGSKLNHSIATGEALGETGWYVTGGARMWRGPKWETYNGLIDREVYILADSDSNWLVGPEMPHTIGDSWVGSCRFHRIPYEGREDSATARMTLKAANEAGTGVTGFPISQSPAMETGSDYVRLAASGSGWSPAETVDAVRPTLELYSPGAMYAVDKILVEKSPSLGAYFDDWTKDSIEAGIHEWEGAGNNSRSVIYPAVEERASLLQGRIYPRRWLML